MTDVSVIVPLRNREHEVASTIRAAADITKHVRSPEGETPEIAVEILALDERSGDNTLSVLSVLHGQIPGLRTIKDVVLGTSLRRASKIARGEVWVILDHAIAPASAAWALNEVLRGARAAVIPGEVLAMEGRLGTRLLAECRGGLVAAQREVVRFLRKHGEHAVVSEPGDGRKLRVRDRLRRGLARLGIGRTSRPRAS